MSNTMSIKTQGDPDPAHPSIFLGRGLIFVNGKNPLIKHAKEKPDNKYKRLLHVGLQRSQNLA